MSLGLNFENTGFIPYSRTRLGKIKWVIMGSDLYFDTSLGVIIVPVGHTTDGPSTPWLLSWVWLFIPRHKVWYAAVLHDYVQGQRKDLSNKLAAALFIEHLQDTTDLKSWQIKCLHFGLRLGAGFKWQ